MRFSQWTLYLDGVETRWRCSFSTEYKAILQDFGWPTHLQATEYKLHKREAELFTVELAEEPFAASIEMQIQDECDKDELAKAQCEELEKKGAE